MSMNNLGFTGSYDPRKIYAGWDPGVNPNANLGGYDPAGVYGDPRAAAPYGGDYDAATEYGAADPMEVLQEPSAAGPKGKKPSKWGKKKLAGMLAAGAGLGASPEPIEHYRFKTPGLLSGRM